MDIDLSVITPIATAVGGVASGVSIAWIRERFSSKKDMYAHMSERIKYLEGRIDEQSARLATQGVELSDERVRCAKELMRLEYQLKDTEKDNHELRDAVEALRAHISRLTSTSRFTPMPFPAQRTDPTKLTVRNEEGEHRHIDLSDPNKTK